MARAWDYAMGGARAAGTRVIVEGFVDFDYEITQLTVRHAGGTTYLDPIGHTQVDGDYRESWQPQPMSDAALAEARRIAGAVTEALGGWGVFGVELFVRGDEVLFSEVSPRPHDTGLVTLVSQDLSEFALHARAILGLPVHDDACTPAASCAVLGRGQRRARLPWRRRCARGPRHRPAPVRQARASTADAGWASRSRAAPTWSRPEPPRGRPRLRSRSSS